jgi:NAD-dependent deacetylase
LFGLRGPAIEEAVELTEIADYFAVIGTSLQVYPAAGLIDFVSQQFTYYIDPKPIKIRNLRNPLACHSEIALKGMKTT